DLTKAVTKRGDSKPIQRRPLFAPKNSAMVIRRRCNLSGLTPSLRHIQRDEMNELRLDRSPA
ncbi:MAG: hypothetical protein K9J74_14290, partial [Sulfuritalea sp.]|nr:hypothetical protein [Sulfuritalea sp.]